MKRIKTFISLGILLFLISVDAQVAVVPAPDQQSLLKSADFKLRKNKHLVYDFARVVLAGLHLDQVPNFMREDYIQHNPNVATGMKGFLEAFSKLGPPRPISSELKGLVSIQAEGDFVTLSFVSRHASPGKVGGSYTTAWFDMFRIQEGKIAEHWDCDTK